MGSKPWNFRTDKNFGGGKRDRTDDLLHAMQALSQLSYTPNGQQLAYLLAAIT